MSRVFISYKRADKDEVFPLKDKIEAAIGEPCWIDLDGIESDAQFVNVIISAIQKAEVFLFMYSKRHTEITQFDKDWTAREILFAQEEGKRIVFVNLDASPLSSWFKFMFGSKQQVDATNPESFNRLLADLRSWLTIESDTNNFTEGLAYEFDDSKKEARLEGIGTAKDTDIKVPAMVQHNGQNYAVTTVWFFDEGNTRISSVTLPKTMIDIDAKAFNDCSHLIAIYVDAGNPKYSSENGVLFNKKKNYLVSYPAGRTGDYRIPDGVIEVGPDSFFAHRQLGTITFPYSVEILGDFAFQGSNVDIRELPSNLVEIHQYALAENNHLTSITIPENTLFIENMAFAGCQNLCSVRVLNPDTEIERFAFFQCANLKKAILPKGLTFPRENPFPADCEIIWK